MGELTSDWKRLPSEKLDDLYSSPNIFWVIKSRRIKWAGHVARIGERRRAYRVWVGKHEGKRSLGKPRSIWEHDIKIDYQKFGCGNGLG